MAKEPLYEGKAKKLFEGPEPGTLIQHFKDDATAFNNKKKGVISGKGIINNRISEYVMTKLAEIGIPTHFIKHLNMREQLVRSVEIIPLEVIIRNYAAGSFAQRFGVDEGEPIGGPLIEFCLKNDELGDPFLAESHILAFELASPDELEEIHHLSVRINDFLSGLFLGKGMRLVDMKLEFGRFYEDENDMRGTVILADEISPDTCRLWDVDTDEKMDKDRFRRDLGKVEEAYQEVARRLGVLPGEEREMSPAVLKEIVGLKKGSDKKAGEKKAAKKPEPSPKKPADKSGKGSGKSKSAPKKK